MTWITKSKAGSRKRAYLFLTIIALLLYVAVQLAWGINLYKAHVEKEKQEVEVIFNEVLEMYAFSSFKENLKNPVESVGLNIERVLEAEKDSVVSGAIFEINLDSRQQMTNLLSDITILTGIIKDSEFLDRVTSFLESKVVGRDVSSFKLTLLAGDEEIGNRKIELKRSHLWNYQQIVYKHYETNEQQYRLYLEVTSSLPSSLSLVFILFILGVVVLVAILILLVRMSRELRLERESTQQQEIFFYGLVHDLKLPLSLAHSMLYGLRSDHSAELSDELESGLTEADQYILKLTEDVNTLLLIRRAREQRNFSRRAFYLYDLLEDIIGELISHYPEKGITLERRFDTELQLYQPIEELRLILRVLLDNAVKYNDLEPSICIDAVEKNDSIAIVICDEGEGIEIAIEQKEQLITPVWIKRVSQSSSSGVGLMTAWSLISAMGGEMRYEKSQPRGSKFTILLQKTDDEKDNAYR